MRACRRTRTEGSIGKWRHLLSWRHGEFPPASLIVPFGNPPEAFECGSDTPLVCRPETSGIFQMYGIDGDFCDGASGLAWQTHAVFVSGWGCPLPDDVLPFIWNKALVLLRLYALCLELGI